jgi:predicted dienelactone hydrolase
MKIIISAAFILTTSIMPVFAGGVGFTRIITDDPMGGEMRVSLWYPANQVSGTVRVGPFTFKATRDAEPSKGLHGLIVISHGTAGSDLGHRNIAVELADAGFIVAAPLHPRDNYEDNSDVGRRIVMEGRPLQISATVDALLSIPMWRERINSKRIAAFGFSLGGYTVLAVLGAKPDMSNIIDHCVETPADPFCDIGGNLAETTRKIIELDYQEAPQDVFDPRFCAASIADPVAVPFSDEALASIKAQHIQIWRPGEQNVLLAEAHASRVVRQLNTRSQSEATEEIVVPGAQHYSFLAPFPQQVRDTLPHELIKDSHGFNRVEFQQRFASEVANFLSISLARCGGNS